MRKGIGGIVLAIVCACGSSEEESGSADVCTDTPTGCTAENIAASADSCAIGVFNFRPCANKPELQSRPFPMERYVDLEVDVCKEVGFGASVACIAEKADLCQEPGEFGSGPNKEPVMDCLCPGGDPACADECTAAFESCGAVCPSDSWESCLDCVAECDIAQYECRSRC